MVELELLPAARHDIAELCELLAEPARVAMVLALMDGGARPAGELARAAGITAQTASSHLGKLLAGGVLAVARQGRHRYYRVANVGVAQAVEALGVARPPRCSRGVEARERPLALARTCYRHLAGKLGVALRERLEAAGFIVGVGDAYELCPLGVKRLAPLLSREPAGAEVLTGKRCVDWTERQFHIGGPLGQALTTALFDEGWVRRVAAGRELRVTTAGERGLSALLGLETARLGTSLQAAERVERADGARRAAFR